MRITRYAATLAAFGLVLTGCASEAGDQAEEAAETPPRSQEDVEFDAGTTMAELDEAGAITVGTKFDQPGFGLQNPSGEPRASTSRSPRSSPRSSGIDADDIDFVETVSANREAFIQNGQVDIVVATYTINDTRKEVVDFAGPYYEAGQDIMVAKGNPEGIDGPGRPGRQDASARSRARRRRRTSATNYPEAQLTLFDVYSKCADDLKNGKVEGRHDRQRDPRPASSPAARTTSSWSATRSPRSPTASACAKGDDEFCEFINDDARGVLRGRHLGRGVGPHRRRRSPAPRPPSRRPSTATDAARCGGRAGPGPAQPRRHRTTERGGRGVPGRQLRPAAGRLPDHAEPRRPQRHLRPAPGHAPGRHAGEPRPARCGRWPPSTSRSSATPR